MARSSVSCAVSVAPVALCAVFVCVCRFAVNSRVHVLIRCSDVVAAASVAAAVAAVVVVVVVSILVRLFSIHIIHFASIIDILCDRFF